MHFSKGFVWGAASASHQVEGAAYEGDKGLSVWDTFSRQPGKTWQGETGAVACDHYHRYKEDVALMKGMGLQAYRFSVSWPRVMPTGTGAVSAQGLDFYDRLTDELLAAGIEPWVTLFHWDYPHDLYLRGGWLNPESPRWFADYSEVIVKKLSDRVTNWMTLNEPQCFIGLGHDLGSHAPGLKLSRAECLLAAHHVMLAHGLGVQAIRAHSSRKAIVGWAPVGMAGVPASDSPEDLAALKQHVFRVGKGFLWNNAWWGDPVVLGHYPEAGLLAFGDDVPKYTDADMLTIGQPLDFYGANIYGSPLIKATPDGGYVELPYHAGFPQTHFYWEMTPESLYWGPSSCTNATSSPSSSPKTACPTPTGSASTDTSTTPSASTSCTVTCCSSTAPCPKAWTCAATSTGASWTTTSGPKATSSASAWSTSTTRRRNARPKTPPAGMPR